MTSATRFSYVGWRGTPAGELTCRYDIDGEQFTETFSFGAADWDDPATQAAAGLLFLAAGVSYYKTRAPAVIDLHDTPVGPATLRWLREFYVEGLGEFAYKNGLDLTGIEFVGGAATQSPTTYRGDLQRPLVPFGGGIDSIVTVESIRDRYPEAALFVVNRPEDRFAAIECPAKVSGLPIVRVGRSIDVKLLDNAKRGYLNGHVPVTGIISAAAVVSAVLEGCGVVVMSNEWSSSSGTIIVEGRSINHQYSKSLAFEESFREALAELLGDRFSYFSALRAHTELWIARRFAELEDYHSEFRSCNRAFHIDTRLRLDQWCGECDKCCFIDLILAPFLDAKKLVQIFGNSEPLERPDLIQRFRALLGAGDTVKPFECVGDAEESRTAVVLAAARTDRRDSPVLQRLAAEVGSVTEDVDRLFRPMGRHFVPDAYAIDD